MRSIETRKNDLVGDEPTPPCPTGKHVAGTCGCQAESSVGMEQVAALRRLALAACDGFDAQPNHGSPYAKRIMDDLRKAANSSEFHCLGTFWNDREIAVIDELAKNQELSPMAVLRQSLRHYQLAIEGTPDLGEKSADPANVIPPGPRPKRPKCPKCGSGVEVISSDEKWDGQIVIQCSKKHRYEFQPDAFTFNEIAQFFPVAAPSAPEVDEKRLAEIRERVKKATAQLPLTEEPAGSGEFDCPLCGGDGSLDAEYVKNFETTKASGVQVFGIGKDLTELAEFVDQSFRDIPYLLEQIESLRRSGAQEKICTCPKTVWTGSEPNDSTCELTEEEHAALAAHTEQGQGTRGEYVPGEFSLAAHKRSEPLCSVCGNARGRHHWKNAWCPHPDSEANRISGPIWIRSTFSAALPAPPDGQGAEKEK